jgi:hypothetical protein
MRIPFRKAKKQEKKITWTVKLARFLSRSRALTVFGGLVALFGGARALQKRTSNG